MEVLILKKLKLNIANIKEQVLRNKENLLYEIQYLDKNLVGLKKFEGNNIILNLF
jgi:hypothetical protein